MFHRQKNIRFDCLKKCITRLIIYLLILCYRPNSKNTASPYQKGAGFLNLYHASGLSTTTYASDVIAYICH